MSERNARLQILLVEDNLGDAVLLRETLSESATELDLAVAERLDEALEHLQRGGYDLVLLDLNLPDSRGFDTFEAVARQAPSLPIILLTGMEDESIGLRAVQQGAEDYLIKGQIADRALIRAVRFATERKKRESQSEAMHQVREQVWGMESPDDFEDVVMAIRSGLEILEVPIHRCALNTVEDDEDIPAVWSHSMSRDGAWVEAAVASIDTILQIWLNRQPEYRPALLQQDPLKEGSLYGEGARSLLHIPFEQGVLTISSTKPDAFPPDRIESLKSLLTVLEEGFRRMEDMRSLQLRNQELESAIAQLGKFGQVVSNDLLEPLSTVEGYLERLTRQDEDRFDRNAQEDLEFACDGVKRISVMIHGLMAYSSIRTEGGEFEAVSCEEILERLQGRRHSALETLGGELVSEPLPTVIADGQQLASLFEELVDNAIRFRGGEPPRIRVTAERSRLHWSFAVSDDGIGIDPNLHDRIFDVFQRFNQRADHQGSGVGLAICRSIVERHGGRMTVESEPGVGSTFRFTLPTRR